MTEIACPRPPEDPPRQPFPLFASLAPVGASVAIWAVTQSPFALVFAVLGPVVAVAALGDARRQRRRRVREERTRFERELVAAHRAIDAAQEQERQRADRLAPGVAHVLSAAGERERWRRASDSDLVVALGVGTVPSGIRIGAAAPGVELDAATSEGLQLLRDRARSTAERRLWIEMRGGLGIVGPGRQARAVAGAVVAQLAHALAPEDARLVVRRDVGDSHRGDRRRGDRPVAVGRSTTWADSLPHADRAAPSDPLAEPTSAVSAPAPDASGLVMWEFTTPRGLVVVASAEDARSLPPQCDTIVRLQAGARAQVSLDGESTVEFVPDLLSDRQGALLAHSLSREAARRPHHRPAGTAALPDRLEFGDLMASLAIEVGVVEGEVALQARGLTAAVGVSGQGLVHGGQDVHGVDDGGGARVRHAAFMIDLVAEGPHAIVGGTTGSGKSELLVTWILGMAAVAPPHKLNFLLVDFKGGASFECLRPLPHVVGTLTDLDEGSATRALESLRAELRFRESLLAEHGARSIEELRESPGESRPQLARLVIVVDEFAALTTGYPELHGLFADLAARGRSLGIHLILCTQRPEGSVRDSVLANCALRISLRVNNAADSIAVIGSPRAAELPRHPPGRALVAREDAAVAVQWALAGESDVAAIAERWGRHGAIRRPWLDPLPTELSLEDLPVASERGIVFGVLDRPERQCREAAIYDPLEQGNLLIVGGRRSGKSGVLAALAAQYPAATLVPESVEGAWDVITDSLELVRSGERLERVLLLDDLDRLLGRFGLDHRGAFLDTLGALTREGPGAGLRLVATSAAPLGALPSFADALLVLRMPDRQSHALVTGNSTGFDPRLPPGGGYWNGARAQVLLAPPPPPAEAAPVVDLAPGRTVLVVTTTPHAARDRFAEHADVTLLDVLAERASTLATPPLGAATSPAEGEIAVASARPTVIIGDPDAWSSAWSVLGQWRSSAPMVFHACPLAEYRTLSRRRELPPPLPPGRDHAWLVHPEGAVERVRLPPSTGHAS